MTDYDVIDETEDGRHRVILMPDEYPDEPYDESGGYVFAVDYTARGWEVSTLAEPTGDPFTDDIASDITDVLNSGPGGADWDAMETKLRDSHDVVSVARYDRRTGGVFLAVVTHALCDAWGIPTGAPFRNESARLDEWIAYDEGDVYWYVVQKRVTWHTDDEDYEDREQWEDTDSCFGFFGRDWAEESAREAFHAYASELAS